MDRREMEVCMAGASRLANRERAIEEPDSTNSDGKMKWWATSMTMSDMVD